MNELSGQIPLSLLALPNLTQLDISKNNLMGSVDLASSLWRLENLTVLGLSHNKLTVMEGLSTSTYPSRLVGLGLASCNMTKIPNVLMCLNHMVSLDLSSNKISEDIPNWISQRWSFDLQALNLSHNFFTSMELNLYIIPSRHVLVAFDLSSNKLQGHIPMPSSSAIFLDYSNNMFSSLLPNFTLYLSSTQYLKLSNNNISGHLPHSICRSPLQILDLSYNKFSGLLPPCLMENGLVILSLRENQFKGMLPSNISSGCSAETIDLHGNKIEGQLLRALCNCTNLKVLDLGMNQIVDTFPFWLLVLKSNHFHGSI
jgi:Leucine-rich repeat (LRR) protein